MSDEKRQAAQLRLREIAAELKRLAWDLPEGKCDCGETYREKVQGAAEVLFATSDAMLRSREAKL